MVSKNRKYTYNDCGDLIEKTEADGKTWRYEYTVGGLMEKVTRPDGKTVKFAYDPIGRRISKTYDGKTTKYIWDGNNILHEWTETEAIIPEATPQNITPIGTWLFENNSFTPIAKLTETNAYTIITNHLGTPTAMLNQTGGNVWNVTLDLWGRQHREIETRTVGGVEITTTAPKTDQSNAQNINTEDDIPFRFPGQYEDEETGLYYNRFRYYMPDEGIYTQRDPIGLVGGNPTVYGYVWSSLMQVDPFGLSQSLSDIQKIIDGVLKDNLPDIRNIVPDAVVGYRGSTASGISGAHNPATARPINLSSYDVDGFIISDNLSNNRMYDNTRWRSGSRNPDLRRVQRNINRQLRAKLPGMRPGRNNDFTFRIFTRQEANGLRANGDVQRRINCP
jgi:RHS repeat-associated protein